MVEAIAHALELDEAEHAHLFHLARALGPPSPRRRRRTPRRGLRPSIHHILDGLTGAAAFVHNARLDNLAANHLGHALYSDMFSRGLGPDPVHSARYVFLDPSARAFYIDWDRAASDLVAILRSAAGREPEDRDLIELIGELSTQSDEFRTRWAAHNVRFHDTGPRTSTTPSSGTSPPPTTDMELAADPGLAITISTAEPGTKSAEALNLLGSWAATPAQPELQDAGVPKRPSEGVTAATIARNVPKTAAPERRNTLRRQSRNSKTSPAGLAKRRLHARPSCRDGDCKSAPESALTREVGGHA